MASENTAGGNAPAAAVRPGTEIRRPGEEPLRMELFSAEQRRERGRTVSHEHLIQKIYRGSDLLLRRLRENESVIREVQRRLVDDVTAKTAVNSVGEWLVDNFYVIEEQISLCERHLPKKYLSELPRLANEGREGIPRVYDLAEHIVAYGDGRVEIDDISEFIETYQEAAPLKLGELWAIPIMLRLALIENIRRIAALARRSRNDREDARKWADTLIRAEERNPKEVILIIADMAREQPWLTGSFVAEFKRRLQGRGTGMRLPLQWVEQSLNETDHSIDQVVSAENHRQAVLEMSIRNCINSLRALNVTDWKKFVECMSVVEHRLREDPAGVYPDMDFTTRDHYRQIVETLAKKSGRSEPETAEECLRLARQAAEAEGQSAAASHVGYWLIGPGEKQLMRSVGFRGGFADSLRHASSRLRLTLYLGSIAVLTALFTAVTVLVAHASGVRGDMLLVMGILLAFSTLHLAVGLVNFVVTQIVRPRTLPRMNYSKGVPPDRRTLVVVPVIVGGAGAVEKMLLNLETLYLNNRGDNIHFGLLTDFSDAPKEALPEDEAILLCLKRGVRDLNEKYPDDGGNNFFLFHRPRKWNEIEKVWMGWERKRGKLEDLNRFLTGADPNVFSCMTGCEDILSEIRYVITLDADTQMARDSAWQLVGTMAHPLNRPVYDEALGRVVSGHGILQPRVESALSGANRSHYARMCSTEIGVDPYTRASSDVYQDLFDEGSFIGKGIYDVAVFDQAVGGRFPDNKILSHDLLEGCVVRSGLVSDVRLYEDPPASYLGDIMRRHRWVRGDWQIASYLVASETRRGFRMSTHPLNLLSQWKVFDNLRRSLTPIALLLLLILGLAVLDRPGLYLLVVCGVFLVPVAVGAACRLVRKPPDKTFGQHMRSMAVSTVREAADVLFKAACMPFEAWVNMDAIVRSLWRQGVSRRRLLQWNPFDNSHNASMTSYTHSLRRMWAGPVLAVIMTAVVALENRTILPLAAPLFLLWLLSPFFAAWLSRPLREKAEELDTESAAFLRLTARRIWLFFEDFVTEAENWLPPDNYQEYPVAVTAHRTSPTNMGLALLASLSAWDFGYISGGQLLERTRLALQTMSGLERYRGHFYNWYDTQTLQVLSPAYVSTVDSGNLAAHLIVLAEGLRELEHAPVTGGRVFLAVRDALDLAAEESAAGENSAAALLDSLRAELDEAAAAPPAALPAFRQQLERISALADQAADAVSSVLENGRAARWMQAVREQCQAALNELDALAPWSRTPADSGLWERHPEMAAFRTLAQTSALPDELEERDADSFPQEWKAAAEKAAAAAAARLDAVHRLAGRCEDMASIDFDFLYDQSRRLLSIGYNAEEHRLDASFYDLLASEARLAAYVGVAQHKVPLNSWWALGRTLTLSGRYPLLVSWSGSMFEYLMPLLVMPTYRDTLLDETYKACVSVQMDYGTARGVPWGISESGYNVFDSEQNYQYRAFGVPELGLKHGLSEDLVVAPYAAVLAAMVFPARACQNLRRLAAEEGCLTPYGFYEAIDYTPGRRPAGKRKAVVRSFMAHHQGMSLVALGQVLLDRPMHRRFAKNPMLESASMLLQEMAPSEKAMYYHSTYTPEIHTAAPAESPMRVVTNPNTPHPEIQLLSNGRYHVMVTAAGGGYSRWNDIAVTRWREDASLDSWGTFCYLRDRETGEVWSNTYQPVRKPAKHFAAVFSEGKAEFTRRDADFDCHTEIVVSPEDDAEVRRLRITNRTGKRKTLEVTSYAEAVLAPPAADDSHQAFSKLFVQTEFIEDRQAVVCTRRPRSGEERNPLMFHLLAVRGSEGGEVSYETDRLAFLGRGNSPANPDALFKNTGTLGCGHGAVLDPIVSIRTSVTLEPGGTAVVDLITGAAEDGESLHILLEKYQDQRTADKAFDLAWSHGQLLLRQLNLTDAVAQQFTQLAGSVVYANPSLRADPSVIMRNHQGQSGLWSYSVSGDLPIVLLRIDDPSHVHLASQMIQAHTYWRQKGLKADLVIWNEDKTSYRQTLHDQIVSLAEAAFGGTSLEVPGGIFVRPGDRISDEDRVLFQTAARVVMSDADGLLDEQIRRMVKTEMASSSTIVQYRRPEVTPSEPDPVPAGELVLYNGYGGFTPDGREYVIETGTERLPPLPWGNVIANARFGTMISESGASYTWSENAHEFRLTPWANDPVTDGSGEAFYLRDESSGDFWSPMPFPCRTGHQYIVRHGFGYSTFEHNAYGISSKVTVYTECAESIKFVSIRVKNKTEMRRSLSATGYVEWVLGDLPAKTGMHVVTSIDPKCGALFARNNYSDEFRGRTAFLDTDDPGRTVSGDRREFVGRNGSLAQPFALQRANLSGHVGAGMDPCGALQVKFTLGPGQEREIVFRLGAGRDTDEARDLVTRFRGVRAASDALARVKEFWREALGTIQVETPDTAFNFMANGWLLYQSLSCRFWGRSALYQSGGAFGFRDQLQDSMAFLYSEPGLVREHLLKSAAHQFVEGDVMHWWHPPGGRGVRTHCSDDYLWLPYVAERYITVTGDTGILDEMVRFITGRPVPENEESYYDLPERSDEKEPLYEHCKRSILHGLRFGIHGLPLMGTGDWNDGMDAVGRGGKGESVWLAFFLYDTLMRFEPIARQRGDAVFSARCHDEAEKLARNIEANAWDDAWYRRAYFDDGTPLGSASSPECRLDSISQSWAVISGAGDPARAAMGMAAVDEQLIDREHMVMKLFAPPFDTSDLYPGYIKGYVPGVRENGGQYTHAAIWTGIAFAGLGRRDKAWEMQQLLNPVNHALTAADAERYKIEPYVVAADIYSAARHQGRGGWSWYTGSASWLYRFLIESILGFDLQTGTVRLRPCIPDSWDGFRLVFRRGKSTYEFNAVRAQGEIVSETGNNDVNRDGTEVPVPDDENEHTVNFEIGR